MKTLIAALTGAAALAIAAPAAGQYGSQNDPYARADARAEARIAQLEARLDAGLRAGEIDRREEWRLRRDLDQLRRLERQYSANGLSARESQDLERRAEALRQQVRVADRGSWDRYEDRYVWSDDGPPYGQAYAYGRTEMSFDDRIDRLEARLEAGLRSGEIDRREAWRLRRDLEGLERLERQYSRNGISREEQVDLQQRLRLARQQIRIADRGSWDRYERRDEWADYDDPYRRDEYGRGGPYEELEPCERRGGIGGLIGGILGVDDCPGLEVGQRVSGNLYAVPDQYRDQFRDGRNIYYRSDGQAIYGIDTRNHTVVRVYPLRQ